MKRRTDPLRRAQRMQRDAARDGFDWPPGDDGLWRKLAEEIRELRAVRDDPERSAEELGDLLFMVVNLARHLGVHPARALDAATRKFLRRYRHIRKHADRLPPKGDTRRLARMEALWREAKRLERSRSGPWPR